MRRSCGLFIAVLFVTTAAGAATPSASPPPAPHVQVATAARPTPSVRLAPLPHEAAPPVHEATPPHELHLGPVAEPKVGTEAKPLSKTATFVKVVRDPSFAVSVANFAAKAALAFSHQGWPVASAAAASLGVVFAGLALARNPKEWGSLPWTTASLGFTGAAAAASLFDPSVSGYLFDAAVATSLPGIASAGKAAVSSTPAPAPAH